jgi:hypothetical protein
MPSFSERNNYKPKKLAQINTVDGESRVLFWNAFFKNYRNNLSTDEEYNFWLGDLFNEIWCNFLKKPADKWPSDYNEFLMAFKSDYFELNPFSDSFGGEFYSWKWWKVYDFLEFILENDGNLKRRKVFKDTCIDIMEKENLGYRIIENFVVPITSKEEIIEIENAISNSAREIQIHLEQSLMLLSDKAKPDFRNSIKEAISAVEGQCKAIAGEKNITLMTALDKIEKDKRVSIHPHLREAFKKIYSWANDSEGIRHSLKEEPTVDKEDAQFMLIACSAFINYLQVKKMKTER